MSSSKKKLFADEALALQLGKIDLCFTFRT